MEGQQELTDIQRFYKDSTVFLTGATGFVGKLFLEKVLWALPVKKVYILIRPKRDVPAAKRFEEIFESPAYGRIKRNKPDVLQKVCIMEGDCSIPLLGLSQEDQKIIIEEVNVIFHIAATIRFDEHIKKSTFTNVRGTMDLITLAKKIEKLKTMVYIGTGFSNCNRREVEEKIYPARITAEKLIAVCENLDDECLSSVTKTLIGSWPNTYTLTKQVTEDYINREGRGLPICITRPTIVVSTLKEPAAAFVDNFFTLAAWLLVSCLGINRISYMKDMPLDIIPADFVVNESIAAGWQTGETFKPSRINRPSEIPVYHISTVMDNPITTDTLSILMRYKPGRAASKHMVCYPLSFSTGCYWNYLFWKMLLHTIPAHIVDLFLRIQGKEPMVVAGYEKINYLHETYKYFLTTPILLHVENTHRLLRKMTFQERELFNFDVTTINWPSYFEIYPKGLRCYIAKDPLETLPEGYKHYNYLRNVFYAGLAIVIILLYTGGKFFLFRVVPVVFATILYALRGVVC